MMRRMTSSLQDRVVLVTGAAQGIGRATAIRFARAGARVAAWDVVDPAIDSLAGELDGLAAGHDCRHVDVTEPRGVEAAVKAVIDRWSRVDVLVNNAGIIRDAQLVSWRDDRLTGAMSDADFDAVIDVNLRAVFLCTRAVVPHMIRQGGGVVLNATSVVGLYGNFGQTNYAAAKAGVLGLTRTWARELGRYGIRVNAVAPGFIDTGIMRTVPEKVLKAMVQRTPLGRVGSPDEVAEAYVWLASDAASFVHGATLSVDGGLVPGS
jgi:3-oxoacyl-[acyl-carrier protein] reductase